MRKKRDSEYHTGRLNISCPPSEKDRIAETATRQGLSISQFMLQLYDKSTQAGTSEHLARMGLELVGLKKRLVDVDKHLRRTLNRNQVAFDASLADELRRLRDLEDSIDATLVETIQAVKHLKEQGK